MEQRRDQRAYGTLESCAMGINRRYIRCEHKDDIHFMIPCQDV